MAVKKKIPQEDPKNIPQVVEFIDAHNAVNEFQEEHAGIFAQYAQLLERYNTALEAAEQVCRSRGVSCGPFDLYQVTVKYNPEKLYEAVGRNRFLELGGSVNTITTYSVDRAQLEVAVTQNKLPEDVLKEVRTETMNFHKPPKAVIP